MRFDFPAPEIAVALLCAVAAGCAASAQTPPPSPPPAVKLAISFPADVTINHMSANGGEQILPETAQLTLTNASLECSLPRKTTSLAVYFPAVA